MGDESEMEEENPIESQRKSGCRLREFDPVSYDWHEWEILLDTYFTVENITNSEKKRNLLITALAVKPFKTLISICKPKKPTECSYEEIVSKLRTNYARVTFASTERINFFSSKQSPSQSLTDFANQLRDKTTTCKFPSDFYEEALITAFVGGLSDAAVRKHLMQQELQTFEQTLNMANTIHSILVQGSNIGPPLIEEALVNKVQERTTDWEKRKLSLTCTSCGNSDHLRAACKFKDAKCYKCGKKGHIAKTCRSKPNFNQVNIQTIVATTTTSDTILDSAFIVSLQIDQIEVKFELDTGSPITIINSNTWNRLGQPRFTTTKVIYRSFTGHPIHFRGETMVNIQLNGENFRLKTMVTYNNQANLLGRDWINSLKLINNNLLNIGQDNVVAKIFSSTKELDEIIEQYGEIFQSKLGCSTTQAHLYLKPDAQPKFCKPRSIPFAYREAVEQDLARLVQEGIIEAVNFSKWAAPIVVVPKPEGKVRICADFSTGVNQALDIDQYPLPKPNDLFVTLNGGIIFSKIDFSEAYLQVQMDESSKDILVINTHKGLYRFNRLPFGVASAPSIFQKLMDQMLSGLQGTVAYLDDIIVTGKSEAEHIQNLKHVFERIREHGFHINKKKCSFGQSQVEYLGFVVDKNGVHTSSTKTQAIVEMPKPNDISQLRSFLGMVNHYTKFVPHLAAHLAPFYVLLKKGSQWKWNLACDKAFTDIKQCLSSPLTLTHYDPKQHLVLATDASMLGLGAVIYHRFPDGKEKPIAFASKTLTETESRYARIEKEALGIIYGLNKFDQFLRGRHFTLITDHKPLITIFGPKRGIPTTSANRLQRWALKLMGYSYDIEYCSTLKFGQADGLSRLPVGPDLTFDNIIASEQGIIAAIQKEVQDELPIRSNHIAQETKKDKTLSLIYQFTQASWPEKFPENCHSYFRIRHELSISHGCLIWGLRTIIPTCFRSRLLKHLHTSHSGMARMKAEARRYFWWPKLDQDIEIMSRNCKICTENSKSTVKVPLNPWPTPSCPWERIHIDYMGRFMGYFFLVVVDAFSKWPEVITMNHITTQATINALSSLFSRYGLCNTIVSDNGTQFTSSEFNDFCLRNGIQHIRTAPAHAQSNGQAERYVEIIKSALTKSSHEGGSVAENLTKILFKYRTTPHATTGSTPAELFLNRPMRTVLDLLRPNYNDSTSSARNRYERNFNRHTKERYFSPGDTVLVKDFRTFRDKVTWRAGILIERQGSRLWSVKVDNQIWRRHENQMKIRKWLTDNEKDSDEMILTNNQPSNTGEHDGNSSTSEDTTISENNAISEDISSSTPTSVSSPSSSSVNDETPVLRRSSRIRKPVHRYIEEI